MKKVDLRELLKRREQDKILKSEPKEEPKENKKKKVK